MKKIVSLILAITSLFLLTACAKYKPVSSTKEEAQTVMTLSFEDIEYEVPYELYRTFFLNHKSEIDGGDSSVWVGAERQRYIDAIDAIIIPEICDIYSVFHLCNKADIDIFSSVVEQTIEDYIEVSVDGGTLDDSIIEGHDGDYDAYLARLKELNMNYSVQVILFRYAVCSELLDVYYYDKNTGDGALKYTREDVKAFYDSDECVRVINHFFDLSTPINKEINTDARIDKIQKGMQDRASDEDAVCTYLISETMLSEELRDGMIIARNSLDPIYYSELTDAAFALDMHEVSDKIELSSGAVEGVYLLYRAGKSDSHFESCYSDIESVYAQNVIGEKLALAKAGLIKSAEKTDVLINYDYSSIKM